MYNDILTEILVFKTNISAEDIKDVAAILSEEKNIRRWNIDLQDIDNVLRIECEHIHPLVVTNLLQAAGFLCDELT
jgi:hypothetical protein